MLQLLALLALPALSLSLGAQGHDTPATPGPAVSPWGAKNAGTPSTRTVRCDRFTYLSEQAFAALVAVDGPSSKTSVKVPMAAPESGFGRCTDHKTAEVRRQASFLR